jgi:L-ascorbate metabolism protein UlaG (beta-lactamase superfamily)
MDQAILPDPVKPARRRWRDRIRQFAGLRQSLRGGPGYDGPVSDHFDGREFFNPGASAGRSLRDLLRWQFTRKAAPWPSWVDHDPTRSVPVSIPADHAALTFINHVTFLIQLPELTVLTDPVFAQRASPVEWAGPRRVHAPGVALEALPSIDLVFVSHNHYDHMDLESLRQIAARHAPLFVTGLGNGAFLREQGIAPVTELDWWEETSLRGVQLRFTPAQHWSSRGPGRRNHTLWGGLWLDAAHCSVFFAGDTGYSAWFVEMRRRYGAPDLALLPIGAYEPRWFMRDQHMNPEEAVQAHLDLGARVSIAMHFGCFRLTDEAIDAPVLALEQSMLARGLDSDAFHVPEPGETFHWQAP